MCSSYPQDYGVEVLAAVLVAKLHPYTFFVLGCPVTSRTCTSPSHWVWQLRTT
jgi:hypothetical protein